MGRCKIARQWEYSDSAVPHARQSPLPTQDCHRLPSPLPALVLTRSARPITLLLVPRPWPAADRVVSTLSIFASRRRLTLRRADIGTSAIVGCSIPTEPTPGGSRALSAIAGLFENDLRPSFHFFTHLFVDLLRAISTSAPTNGKLCPSSR